LLLRHAYCVLKNIKSIRALLMFKGNEWDRRSYFISKVWHRNLCKERNFFVVEEWTKLQQHAVSDTGFYFNMSVRFWLYSLNVGSKWIKNHRIQTIKFCSLFTHIFSAVFFNNHSIFQR
jgi:hypothetical protein